MLVQRGHTYVAAARLPALVPLSVVRNELVSAGFVNVSVRSADGPNYNAVGQGTWTGADEDVELPSQVVWVHDVTPAAEPEPAEAGAPAPGPIVTPTSPSAPSSPTPAPAPRRRRRAPAPPDQSVPVVALFVSGIGALVLWKLKKDGFWNRRAWRR
ncbi:MAG: hypothetical protein ACRD1X_17980 [Vicinamibacteria bacterium]